MNPTASRNLFKPLPALREPVSGPKFKKKKLKTRLSGSLGDLLFVSRFGARNGLMEAREVFKKFLEAVGFILAKFEPKPSHGDPIRDQNYGLGTYDMCWNIYIYGIYIYTIYYRISDRDMSHSQTQICLSQTQICLSLRHRYLSRRHSCANARV